MCVCTLCDPDPGQLINGLSVCVCDPGPGQLINGLSVCVFVILILDS